MAEALDCGADDFLSKPFSFVVLTARLRALIRRGHVPRPPVIEVGPLQLDPFTRTCTVADQELQLTAREAALLAALGRGHPRMISRAELLNQVRGPEFDGDPNIVDVYVGHLRRKLATTDGDARIVNRRGVGFRIEHA